MPVVDAPKRNFMTPAMHALLVKAPTEWGKLPRNVTCVNQSLVALEGRKLIEMQFRHNEMPRWLWRRVPETNAMPELQDTYYPPVNDAACEVTDEELRAIMAKFNLGLTAHKARILFAMRMAANAGAAAERRKGEGK
jgi:hypothetical protein